MTSTQRLERVGVDDQEVVPISERLVGGLPAWATWLVVHIFFLIGFRNRVAVLFEWAYTYFTFTRGARLITGDHTLPGWDRQEGDAPVPTGTPTSVVGSPTAPSYLAERTETASKQPA